MLSCVNCSGLSVRYESAACFVPHQGGLAALGQFPVDLGNSSVSVQQDRLCQENMGVRQSMFQEEEITSFKQYLAAAVFPA